MKSLVNKPHNDLTKKAIAQRFGISIEDPTTPKDKPLRPIPKKRCIGKSKILTNFIKIHPS